LDNLTHTLTALAMSQAGLNRKTRFATLALVIGANLPDIDLLWSMGGHGNYLKYHRGFTHSLAGVAVLGAALAALIHYVGQRAGPPKKASPPLDARWLFIICWIATGSHLLMDFTNAYGVRLFSPFSERWYAWDIMPIVDFLLLALLILGLGVPALFRIISEEVGARKPAYQRGAIFALAGLVLLWGVRDLAHRRALSLLDANTYGHEDPLEIGAFPTFASPLAWSGVAETNSAFYVLGVDALADNVDPRRARVLPKAEPSPALEAALKTRTGGVFADFARFLWSQVDETEDGYDVTLRDLRFASVSEERPGFVVRIALDKNLRVESEEFSFSGRTRN
jgi:inner membrane protein